MEKITKKLKELETLINETEKTNANAAKIQIIRTHIRLALNAATFKSRVVVNNYKPKTEEPKEQPKPQRGRPKKKENKNVLATSAQPKTLKEKLDNE